MHPPAHLPFGIEGVEVRYVLGEQCATIHCRVCELIIVGDSAIISRGFGTSNGVVSPRTQGGCESYVDHLIGVNNDS